MEKARPRWACRRHTQKGLKCIKDRYFIKDGTRNWAFFVPDKGKTYTLKQHSDTKIERHVKVKGTKHIFDGDTVYWASLCQKDPTMNIRVRKLLKLQKGICNWCNHHFRCDDVMEVDHVKPRKEGGKDVYANLQLLHGHCHETKTHFDTRKAEAAILKRSDWEMVR